MIQRESPEKAENSGASDNTPESPDNYILQHLEHSDNPIHQEEIFSLVYAATGDLRQSCINSLNAIIDTLDRVNHCRWTRAPGSDPNLSTRIDELRTCLQDFKNDRRLSVLEPFEHVIGMSSSTISNNASRKMLFFAFTYEANLIWLGESLLELLDIISGLALKHPYPRLWAPKGLRLLWKIILLDNEDEAVSERNDYHVDPAEAERQNIKYS